MYTKNIYLFKHYSAADTKCAGTRRSKKSFITPFVLTLPQKVHDKMASKINNI